MTDAEPRQVIADAIANTSGHFASSVETEGAMCTGWVLVAEWTDADGNWWMSQLSDKGMPTWRCRGLLSEALADLGRPDDD